MQGDVEAADEPERWGDERVTGAVQNPLFENIAYRPPTFDDRRMREFAAARWMPVDQDGWQMAVIYQAAIEHAELAEPKPDHRAKRGRPSTKPTPLRMLLGLKSPGEQHEDEVLEWVETRQRERRSATGIKPTDIECLRMYVIEIDREKPDSDTMQSNVKTRQSMMLRARKRRGPSFRKL